MKTIDIPTVHNIIIRHELASVFHRILAFFIDGLIMLLYLSLIISIFGPNNPISYIFGYLVVLLYHLLFEIFNRGQSPGKQIMQLRVVSIYGLTPNLQDYIMRWAFRLIDITLSGSALAVFSILISQHSQRIGDILGRTTVINLRASRPVDLEAIHTLSDKIGQVIYAQVSRYNDRDMLLIKHTLQRYKQTQNTATQRIMLELAQRVAAELKVPLNPGKADEFLKKVLEDYILATR